MMHYETIVQGVLLPTLQLREQRRQVARHAMDLPRGSNEQSWLHEDLCRQGSVEQPDQPAEGTLLRSPRCQC